MKKKTTRKSAYMRLAVALIFMQAIFYGCAGLKGGTVVHEGDQVLVNYTCRLKTGEVVFTTLEEIAQDESTRASVFIPLKEYGPDVIVAGSDDTGPAMGKLKVFESEMRYRIARQLTGMRVGSKYTITLTSQAGEDVEPGERYMSHKLVRKNEKIRNFSHEFIMERVDEEPATGDRIQIYEGMNGVIQERIDNYYVVSIEVVEGFSLETEFGRAYLKNGDDTYFETVIDVQVGRLVRTGELIGRINRVGPERFMIDYAHPFGYEEIMCDVTVEAVQDTPDKE